MSYGQKPLTLQEAAQLAGMGKNNLLQLIHDGKLPRDCYMVNLSGSYTFDKDSFLAAVNRIVRF